MAAPKIPASTIDEEIGRTKVFDPVKSPKAKSSVVSVSPSEKRDPLFKTEYAFGLTGKGKYRKTKKSKKLHRKTKKRSYRK